MFASLVLHVDMSVFYEPAILKLLSALPILLTSLVLNRGAVYLNLLVLML